MNQQEIEKAGRRIQWRFPFIGHLIRLRAVKKLAFANVPETIPVLVNALNLFDLNVSEIAYKSLFSIKNSDSINKLCQLWYQYREKKLEEIIISAGYVAEEPTFVRSATALINDKFEICDQEQMIEHLVQFMKDRDTNICHKSEKALRILKNSNSINKLCQLWYQSREKKLEEIIISAGYVAEEPTFVRSATALINDKFEICDQEQMIEHLVQFMKDRDTNICQKSEKALRILKNSDSIQSLCFGIVDGLFDHAIPVAVEAGYQPADTGRRCVFFVLTGQVGKYLDLDYEFQYLRAEYQAAPAGLQQRIRAVIQRSNDNRLIGLFGEVRKKFVAKDLTAHEAELMLNIFARNGQMDEIFALIFFAPLDAVLHCLDTFSNAEWAPADELQRELLEQILKVRKQMGSTPEVPPDPEVALGPVFMKWIEEGRSEIYLSKSKSELQKAFDKGEPAAAISALTALHQKGWLDEDRTKLAKKHPHWMVRLVYSIFIPENGSCFSFDESGISTDGGEYWLNLIPAFNARNIIKAKAVQINPDTLNIFQNAIDKAGSDKSPLRYWAILLTRLSGYSLRNTITIGNYEKRLEDTSIGIER